jgi:hypothetical protein
MRTLSKRLARLENRKEVKGQECAHPDSSIHLFQYPLRKSDTLKSVITMGHCNACGWEGPLWENLGLTTDELNSLFEWRYEPEVKSLAARLIKSKRLAYTSWPPPREIREIYQGR